MRVSFENTLENGSWKKKAEELFSQIPIQARPNWAEKMMWAVSELFPKIKEDVFFQRLIDLIDNPETWGTASTLFEEIRQNTLKSQVTEDEAIYLFFENIAKCVQNSANTPKKYGADAAEGIVGCVLHLAEKVENPEAKRRLLEKLSKDN